MRYHKELRLFVSSVSIALVVSGCYVSSEHSVQESYSYDLATESSSDIHRVWVKNVDGMGVSGARVYSVVYYGAGCDLSNLQKDVPLAHSDGDGCVRLSAVPSPPLYLVAEKDGLLGFLDGDTIVMSLPHSITINSPASKSQDSRVSLFDSAIGKEVFGESIGSVQSTKACYYGNGPLLAVLVFSNDLSKFSDSKGLISYKQIRGVTIEDSVVNFMNFDTDCSIEVTCGQQAESFPRRLYILLNDDVSKTSYEYSSLLTESSTEVHECIRGKGYVMIEYNNKGVRFSQLREIDTRLSETGRVSVIMDSPYIQEVYQAPGDTLEDQVFCVPQLVYDTYSLLPLPVLYQQELLRYAREDASLSGDDVSDGMNKVIMCRSVLGIIIRAGGSDEK